MAIDIAVIILALSTIGLSFISITQSRTLMRTNQALEKVSNSAALFSVETAQALVDYEYRIQALEGKERGRIYPN